MSGFDPRDRHRWQVRRRRWLAMHRVPPALARLLIVVAIVLAVLVIAWVLTS